MGFDSIAEFYPLLFYEALRLQREGPFLLEIFNQYKSPVRVLDLACGTGVHSRFFAEQGAKVVGVDVSVEMLRYAKSQSVSGNINYIVGNFLELPIVGEWDIILCLGNSLCLLPTRSSLRDFFNQIKSLLTGDGNFVLQILNYAHPEMQELQTKCVRKKVGDSKVTVVKTITPDENVVYLAINYFAQIQGNYKTASETNILQKYSLSELADTAQKVGLRVLFIYGDFQKSDFKPDVSKDLIIVCSKT